jgi:hypothetical protein
MLMAVEVVEAVFEIRAISLQIFRLLSSMDCVSVVWRQMPFLCNTAWYIIFRPLNYIMHQEFEGYFYSWLRRTFLGNGLPTYHG